MSKVINYYKECPGSGRELTVGYNIFFEEQKLVGGHCTA